MKFSSQSNASTWIHHNELFQRHPRLRVIEQQCHKTFHNLKQLLSYVFVSGLHRNPFVMSRILYLSLIESEEGDRVEKSVFGARIFDQIGEPNVFSWNTMIRFFASFNDTQISPCYYMKMLDQEMVPDRYTFPFLLQACGSSCNLHLVKQVHIHVLKFGFGHDLFVQNSLLNAYLITGSSLEARSLFDEMPDKDIVSWTSLISGLVSQSEHHEALRVFKKLVAYDRQTRPNVATMVSTMSACGNLGSLDHTKSMHALLEKMRFLELDVSIVNSLIDSYAKCGSLTQAKKLFDEIHYTKKDLYSWTTIISGFAIHGRGSDSLELFSQMEQIGRPVPDSIIFLSILSSCAHSGLVQEGVHIFNSMNKAYHIEPDLRHYGCIIDLFSRSGMLEQAYNILEEMPMEPNLAILGSLLSGCRVHNDLELGECILRKIEFLKEMGGSPVLLSNIYASKNQWTKVMEIRKEMRGMVPEKPPGSSWIVVKDIVHEFVAGDKISLQDVELCISLEALEKLAKLDNSIRDF